MMKKTKLSTMPLFSTLAALLMLGTASVPMNAFANEAYDLVILDGRVMDPQTNFDAVRNVGVKDGKMSYLPAQFLQENGVAQMAFKGRMQVGADADITRFSPTRGDVSKQLFYYANHQENSSLHELA